MVAPFSKSYGKIGVGFCQHWKTLFKANRKNIVSFRNSTRDFQNSPSFERSA